MKDGPDIARIATLIGDPARANMLSALMDGRALTASELAATAGVTRSTASIHLAKLVDGGLLSPTKQGRHRYYALADATVAEVLEALMGLAQSTGAVRVRTGPREPELRQARVCYDHLAGEMGVQMHDSLLARGALETVGEGLELTAKGRRLLDDLGVREIQPSRRRLCRPCLDWSMRRNHLAGALGAALFDHVQSQGWARRIDGSRIVRFTKDGAAAFADTFPVEASPAKRM